ncbi:MAG: hypothetical protein D6731_19580 [Planctomycetota bacterium]|nr:MAG: hypothetical protein D6731_19580 [Planctomycetota bacterium]
MAQEKIATLERRRLLGDLYGLKGWFAGGQCVDHIPRGELVALGKNPAGQTCLYAHGREYPLDASLLYEVRRKSEPVREA